MSNQPTPLAREPKFGEWLRGIYAGERNPQREGMFVRTIHRPRGRTNSGKWYQLTDGNGSFWEYQPESVVFASRPSVKEPLTTEQVLHVCHNENKCLDAWWVCSRCSENRAAQAREEAYNTAWNVALDIDETGELGAKLTERFSQLSTPTSTPAIESRTPQSNKEHEK